MSSPPEPIEFAERLVPAEAASLEAVRGYMEKAYEIVANTSEWDLQEMILAIRYKLSDRIAEERSREAPGGNAELCDRLEKAEPKAKPVQ